MTRVEAQADPAVVMHVRRAIEAIRRFGDQLVVHASTNPHAHADDSVAVVIVEVPRELLRTDHEAGMRSAQFAPGLGQSEADLGDSRVLLVDVGIFDAGLLH